jgi:hypothetical protein
MALTYIQSTITLHCMLIQDDNMIDWCCFNRQCLIDIEACHALGKQASSDNKKEISFVHEQMQM